MCRLYGSTVARLIDQYLNEAVMEPAYRVRVNEAGFCAGHLRLLYGGANKLGLALQLSTRTDAILKKLSPVADGKAAKKEAQKVARLNSTCVICDTADEIMTRYAYTAAQMYEHENDFPSAFAACDGFCMPHYALMLTNADRAGKAAKTYVAALYRLQTESLKKINRDTRRFCEMFDYAGQNKGMKDAEKIVPAAINKLKGEIIPGNR
jgi:hypothetical protein